MTLQKRAFDIVVFGATGYTGQFVVEKLAVVAARDKLTWAIAGRNQRKLEDCLAEAEKNVAVKLPNAKLLSTPIIICDVSDQSSIEAMCKQTHVVLNCVGPYALYGEPIVRACVANGTSHLDVSGEPNFLEKMVYTYDREAEEKGAFVLGACGFDSVPIEAALQYSEEQFSSGLMNDAETYIRLHFGADGYQLHYGTLHSMANIMSKWYEMSQVQKQLAAYENVKLPVSKFRPPRRFPLHYKTELRGWALPFLGTDPVIVARTQRKLYATQKRRPIELSSYMNTGSFLNAVLINVAMVYILFVSLIPPLRWLLLKFPSFMTFGFSGKEGSTRKQIAESSFRYTVFARGWKSKKDDNNLPPNRRIRVDMHGPDAGYVTTALCMVEAAVSLLKERERIGFRGGVLTVGAALRNTDYLKRLQSAEDGFRFEVQEL